MSQKLLIIDGWPVPKLMKYEISYNKVWANDTGKNMSGENKGTLIGIFPEISVEVGEFNQAEMQRFLSIVNKPKFNIDWYDEELSQLTTSISYAVGDYSISLKNAKRMIYSTFSFELIPNKKRL